MNNQNKQIDITKDNWQKRVNLVNSKDITLNGEPATINGFRMQFGYVGGIEWSWPTIEHVINNRNGEFFTN